MFKEWRKILRNYKKYKSTNENLIETLEDKVKQILQASKI